MKDEAVSYAAAVAEVKKSFAGKRHTGDESRRAIAKRWAKINGRKWEKPPAKEATQEAPATSGRVSKIKTPDGGDKGGK